MSIVYTLDIREIKISPQVDDKTDVVVSVGWAYVGSDGERTAAFGGETPFSYTPGDPFTPYEDLTKDQVEKWVIDSWGEDQLKAYQDTISDQLSVRTIVSPWSVTTQDPEPISD